MARNTRQDILDTARRLFNERGYNDVTTRDIADELGISKGNLTYHFKRKEEIVEALVSENPKVHTPDAPTDLHALAAYLQDIEDTVRVNAFYFWHHSQLAQTSERISGLQRDTFWEKSEVLTQAFHTLADSGLVRNEDYVGEYARIVDTILMAGIYWIPFCKLRGENAAPSYVQQAWAILHPLLTNEGKNQHPVP